jgi:hypothetical protein
MVTFFISASNSLMELKVVFFFYAFAVFLINLLSYIFLLEKFFRILCYAKLTFDWFPLLNPYTWPYSFFNRITGPYFLFWSNTFPTLKFKKSAMDVSAILALEGLNALIYLTIRIVNFLIVFLQSMENELINKLL